MENMKSLIQNMKIVVLELSRILLSTILLMSIRGKKKKKNEG